MAKPATLKFPHSVKQSFDSEMLYSGLISSVSVVCVLWLDENAGHLAFLCFMSKDCISFSLPPRNVECMAGLVKCLSLQNNAVVF